jgi:predicted amidohydrolase
MRIALVPLDIVWNNKEVNKTSCRKIIARISTHQVDLIIFPEMTLTGFNMKPSETGEENTSSRTINFFRQEAINNKVGIIFGAVITNETKYLNCAFFIDDKGELNASYSKVHLFSHSNENLFFRSGELPSVATYNNYKIGLTICYDLRFPELYSFLAQDSDFVVNIANWPEKREKHWETLLEARAIENQTTIIGVNRSGKDESGQIFSGNSKIIYPNGLCADPEYHENEFSIYSIEKERAKESVRGFNTVNDRRPGLYFRWYSEANSPTDEKVSKSD